MTSKQGSDAVTDAHLLSACAAIERVLARRHPEHHWIVEVVTNHRPDDDATASPQKTRVT